MNLYQVLQIATSKSEKGVSWKKKLNQSGAQRWFVYCSHIGPPSFNIENLPEGWPDEAWRFFFQLQNIVQRSKNTKGFRCHVYNAASKARSYFRQRILVYYKRYYLSFTFHSCNFIEQRSKWVIELFFLSRSIYIIVLCDFVRKEWRD